jgi:hypothetical protein
MICDVISGVSSRSLCLVLEFLNILRAKALGKRNLCIIFPHVLPIYFDCNWILLNQQI